MAITVFDISSTAWFSVLLNDWGFITICVSLLPFILTYLITSVQAAAALRRNLNERKPPTIPYAVPIFGNLFSFVSNTESFIGKIISRFGEYVPVRIRILNQNMYFISGPENVQAMFRKSRDLTTTPYAIGVLERVFGTPKAAKHIYEDDDTGIHAQPLDGSRALEPQNRIFHIIHKTLNVGLNGPGLAELATQFMTHFQQEVEKIDADHCDEWVDIPDLYTMVQNLVFTASTTALCGPHIFNLNPEFMADFWKFDTCAIGLFQSLPRWLVPQSYIVRDRLRSSIMKWHKFAGAQFDGTDEMLAKNHWEEYFGSKLIRDRQRNFKMVEGMDDEARAASDLGMIWGANANIVPIVGWCIIDILLRPSLHKRVLSELSRIALSSQANDMTLQMPALISNPLLQSIYSEELRLRTSTLIQRVPLVSNFRLGQWIFPKGAMILASSWHEARDRNIWNEGLDKNSHSVDHFWEDRFLVHPGDLHSGPAKVKSAPAPAINPATKSDSPLDETLTQMATTTEKEFTVDPVQGSFIPFGGGQKICPGRFYAKQEAIGFVALLLSTFEIELTTEFGDLPQPNMNFFTLGIVPPKGKFPARIRRHKSNVRVLSAA